MCTRVSGADPGKRKGGGAKSIEREAREVSPAQRAKKGVTPTSED